MTAEMELLALRYSAVDAGFWRRVGQHMDPDRFEHPQAKMILGCVRLHTQEAGAHPQSSVVVVQRAKRLHVAGKIKAERVLEVAETFDAGFDLGDILVDAVIAEVVPLVRRVMHQETVLKAADEYARRGDFSEIAKMLETARGLGDADKGVEGLTVDGAALGRFDAERPDTLATGIPELDVAMEGGMAIKSLGMWMAESGGGKSIALISQAAHAARLGLHVVLATFELSKEQQLARLAANHTGFETNAIMANERTRAVASQMLDSTAASRGPCYVAEYDPGVVTPEELRDLVAEREQVVGRHVDLLVVDYGDKMTAKNISQRDGEHVIMRRVWEGLRDGIARKGNRWVWTASQPKGRRDENQRKKKLDMHDTADSIHKVRVSDVVATLNPLSFDDLQNVEVFVAKNRGNKARYVVGPIFGDHARGRITSNV